jgi:hypothetical protein
MHLVKEAVDANKISIRQCRTNEMIADDFMKLLEGGEFQWFLHGLDIFHCSKSQPGRVEQ